MKTELQEHLDRNPRFRGERGLRRLAQELSNREEPPPETMLPVSATRMEHAAAARIGREWHATRTAYYLSRLQAAIDGRPIVDGRPVLDDEAQRHVGDLLGISQSDGPDRWFLHVTPTVR